MKDCSAGHGELLATRIALKKLPRLDKSHRLVTMGAGLPFGPAEADQIFPAARFIGKTRLEVQQAHLIVGLFGRHHGPSLTHNALTG